MSQLLTAQLRQALVGSPWLLEPAKFRAIIDALVADRPVAAEQRRVQEPGQQTATGIGMIFISGLIVHRSYDLSDWMVMTSTETAGRVLRKMLADAAVGSIVLNIDSPGGMAEGIPELAGQIAAANRVKPVIAIANGYAASGAYWLGTQAGQFYSIPSGEVGSIGVVMVHTDISQMMADMGVKYTVIKAGKFKWEGHPYAPLDDPAAANWQERVDEIYAEFVDAVAAGRRTDAGTVLQKFGEGRMVPAGRATKAGMIDGLATLDQVIAALASRQPIRIFTAAAAASRDAERAAEPAGNTGIDKEQKMSLKDVTVEQLRSERPDLAKAIEDSAIAAMEPLHNEAVAKAESAARAAGKAEGVAEATAAERARCAAIIDAAAKAELQDTAAAVVKQQIAAGADPKDALVIFQAEKITQLKNAQPAAVGPAPPDKGKEPEHDVSTPEGHMAAAKAWQAEHAGCSITDALKATAPKRS